MNYSNESNSEQSSSEQKFNSEESLEDSLQQVSRVVRTDVSWSPMRASKWIAEDLAFTTSVVTGRVPLVTSPTKANISYNGFGEGPLVLKSHSGGLSWLNFHRVLFSYLRQASEFDYHFNYPVFFLAYDGNCDGSDPEAMAMNQNVPSLSLPKGWGIYRHLFKDDRGNMNKLVKIVTGVLSRKLYLHAPSMMTYFSNDFIELFCEIFSSARYSISESLFIFCPFTYDFLRTSVYAEIKFVIMASAIDLRSLKIVDDLIFETMTRSCEFDFPTMLLPPDKSDQVFKVIYQNPPLTTYKIYRELENNNHFVDYSSLLLFLRTSADLNRVNDKWVPRPYDEPQEIVGIDDSPFNGEMMSSFSDFSRGLKTKTTFTSSGSPEKLRWVCHMVYDEFFYRGVSTTKKGSTRAAFRALNSHVENEVKVFDVISPKAMYSVALELLVEKPSLKEFIYQMSSRFDPTMSGFHYASRKGLKNFSYNTDFFIKKGERVFSIFLMLHPNYYGRVLGKMKRFHRSTEIPSHKVLRLAFMGSYERDKDDPSNPFHSELALCPRSSWKMCTSCIAQVIATSSCQCGRVALCSLCTGKLTSCYSCSSLVTHDVETRFISDHPYDYRARN